MSEEKNMCTLKYCPVILKLEGNVSSVHREVGWTTSCETEAPWDLGPGPSESVTL